MKVLLLLLVHTPAPTLIEFFEEELYDSGTELLGTSVLSWTYLANGIFNEFPYLIYGKVGNIALSFFP